MHKCDVSTFHQKFVGQPNKQQQFKNHQINIENYMLRLQDHLFLIKMHFDSLTFHKVAGNLFSLNIQINGNGTERNNVFFQCLHFQLILLLHQKIQKSGTDFSSHNWTKLIQKTSGLKSSFLLKQSLLGKKPMSAHCMKKVEWFFRLHL